MRVLLVEDETRIAAFVRKGLQEEQYVVDVAEDGVAALDFIDATTYDLILLDVMLPCRDGFSVCKEIRRRGMKTPVLMLTARDAVDDRVRGLDAGADDYLVKPFAFKELLARLRALARRPPETQSLELCIGDLTLDTTTHQAARADQAIELSAREYRLLAFLMRHAGQPLTRTQIAEGVWGYDFDANSNVVDVYIRYLRRKVDDPFETKLIQTVRGVGYKIEASNV
ncbi:MAG: response regulator transcription factor [Chloroflexi bacterium]|nr:response regulator transcription factor [Chloroflexota bacterium]